MQTPAERPEMSPAQIAREIAGRSARIPMHSRRGRLLIAIDGRTTAGKTTIAEKLRRLTDCNIVHADDFYLHPAQRTPERYAEPGGNIDYARLRREVIEPWKREGAFSYAPYDAHEDCSKEVVHFDPRPVTVVEGAYSAHPALEDAYDLIVCVTTSPDEQRRRIAARNGPQALEMFENKWIPLEEAYIRETSLEERSDVVFHT